MQVKLFVTPSLIRSSAFIFAMLQATVSCGAQVAPKVQELIHIDAQRDAAPIVPAQYRLDFNRSPQGHVLGLNSRVLTMDGRAMLPVMGEFHFSRVPRAEWEEELLKMKAAGVNIVATYIIWIHHEELEGQFDWAGDNDLRAFALLCQKHGLLLEPRIGPWAHAEVRNGGFPDWVLAQGPTRSNDPRYLQAVDRWYGAIGAQLKGLMWQDGGPVVAIQLENEYAQRGPGAGEEHILTLKHLAIESGMKVPYYFVTGWDNAVIPAGEVIPVYGGGYPDAPWDGSTQKLPPPEVYAFRFHSRVAANMGAIGGTGNAAASNAATEAVPYLTAEIGGGIEDTYHRRPVIEPDDIGSMYPVMLGSGVNLYGSYMYHGGVNPTGRRTTLEESQMTGYPNDVPIKSYDFQAPISSYGEERASLGRMKIYQYFVNAYGDELAPMAVHAPDQLPHDPTDLQVLRASVRSAGDQGYLFVNNYVRNVVMPRHNGVQFAVQFEKETLRVPLEPTDIPAGAYFIWPLNKQLGHVRLLYSTAQLFTQVGHETVFAAVDGMRTEFAFRLQDVRAIHASSGTVQKRDGVIVLRDVNPSVNATIDVETSAGGHEYLRVLAADEARHAWKLKLAGMDRLIITSNGVAVDAEGGVHLRALGEESYRVSIFPAPEKALGSSLPLRVTAHNGDVLTLEARRDQHVAQPDVRMTVEAGIADAVRLAPPPSWRATGVAQAPAEDGSPLRNAGQWSISIPAEAWRGVHDLFLVLDYQGDVARLYRGHELLEDDFYNGHALRLGLRRFAAGGLDGLRLEVLPLRKDAPVYFEWRQAPQFDARGQAVRLEKASLIPEYDLLLAGK